MFGSSLSPVVCSGGMSYLRYLCLFVHSGVQHILFCVCVLFLFVFFVYVPHFTGTKHQFYESMSPFHYNHIEAGIVSGSHSISNVELYTSLADYEFLL
jgi:hypothetical protein